MSNYGSYMHEKIRKLRAQNELSEVKSSIFKSIRIYVNGYTRPSKEELRELILKNGGEFENYETSRVTHIVASNLPATKVRQLKKTTKKLPIVYPEWIVKSIEAGKLLPYQSFVLTSLQDPKQMSFRTSSTKDGPSFVKSFFQKSRLHHIGSWKTHYQQLTNERMKHKQISLPSQRPRVILHVDMDCFFVAVAIRDRPELASQPIAIAHSSSASDRGGFSEISSCNYIARDYGLRAGMFMGKAKELCPDLLVLPYEFAAIQQVSDTIYEIFFQYAERVQAVSCDEAFLQLKHGTDGLDVAFKIRKEISERTKCNASVGVSSNMLLARMATRKAKPAGQFYISEGKAEEYLRDFSVNDLPGVGWKSTRKLEEAGIKTCHDVQNYNIARLRQILGEKTADLLAQNARGNDNRELQTEVDRKSISAEINYGIRLENDDELGAFVLALAEELSDRMRKANVKGKQLTLKLKRRREGAGEPRKYMGMGYCDSLNKTTSCTYATNQHDTIAQEILAILRPMHIPCAEIRGMGIQATKLTEGISSRSSGEAAALQGWLDKSPPKHEVSEVAQELSMSEIDSSVFESLPPDIRHEIIRNCKRKRGQASETPISKRRHVEIEISDDGPEDTSLDASVVILDDTTTCNSALGELRVSQIDENVFNALPRDIRMEIYESIRLQQNTIESNLIPAEKIVHANPVVEPTEEEIPEVGELQGCFEWLSEDWKRWLTQTDPSSSPHIQDLVDDFLVAIPELQLDKVAIALCRLRRQCANHSNTSWIATFNGILSTLQDKVGATFHGALSISKLQEKT